MKSKKMLTMLIVLAVVIVIVIVFASVFSLKSSLIVCHNFEGGKVTGLADAPTEEDVLQLYKGKSILFLSKEDVLAKLNEKYPEWHAIGVVKNFPNILEVHFVKRVAVVKVDIGGSTVYLDSFGYVVDAPQTDEPLDITSAMESPCTTTVNEKGKQIQFVSATNNSRLQIVLDTIMALWQCKCDIENIPNILGKENVFTFDADGTMTVTTRVGAKIHFIDPETLLTQKFIDAFSVYCSEKYDLQRENVEITVYPDGKVTAPNNNLITKV